MTNIREVYDAIVVGGGPAGTATATHLAKAGKSVLLLERAILGRDKPCGEVYSPAVRGLLSTLGALDAINAAAPGRIGGADIFCANGSHFAGRYLASKRCSPWAIDGGFSLERRILDRLLWENATATGVDTRRNVSVCDLLYTDDRSICGIRTDSGDFRARIVIGADGGRSRIARAMDVVRPIARLQKIALIAHYALPSKQESACRTVEMHIGYGGTVCGWAVGADGLANVTFVVPASENRAISAVGKAAYFATLLDRFSAVRQSLADARQIRLTTCGTFGHRVTSPVAHGALLVGDAATFIDPFTGEGVYFALRGAELAVETILDALRRDDLSAHGLQSYVRARHAELAPKYLVCDLVQQVVHQPSLIERLAERCARYPSLADWIVSVTGDLRRPYALLHPSFLWKMAFS